MITANTNRSQRSSGKRSALGEGALGRKAIESSLDKLHYLPSDVASRLAIGLSCYLQAVGIIRRACDLFDQVQQTVILDQLERAEASLGYAVHYLEPIEKVLSDLTKVPGVQGTAK